MLNMTGFISGIMPKFKANAHSFQGVQFLGLPFAALLWTLASPLAFGSVASRVMISDWPTRTALRAFIVEFDQ